MQKTLNKEQSFFENKNNNKKDKTLTLPGLF